MRYLAALLCILTVSCGADGNSSGSRQSPSASTGPLTPNECDKLVRRTYGQILQAGSPAASRMIKSCELGRGHFNRGFFDCVFESKYSDPLDCAYKARGIDRSKKEEPTLKNRKIGDYGHYSGTAISAVKVLKRGEDPRTTIDQLTLDTYLDRRDEAFTSNGESPPNDGRAPISKTSSSIVSNGKTYWIVRESFTDLQLLKIMLEGEKSVEQVVCARYGSEEQLRLDSGYCAALLKKHFNEVPAN